jgi:hypothetical protein
MGVQVPPLAPNKESKMSSIFYGEPKQKFVGNYREWNGTSLDESKYYTDLIYPHIDHALDHVTLDGLYMEFGVYTGRSLRHTAKRLPNKTIYGFDVFTTGLPESWHCVPQGMFSIPVPVFEEKNIELVVGLYDETCPTFPKSNVAYMHIDCDLYSSTKTVFDNFADYIVPGTVIVFDEYYNYGTYQDHEYKAFKELLEFRKLSCIPLGVVETEAACPASFLIT